MGYGNEVPQEGLYDLYVRNKNVCGFVLTRASPRPVLRETDRLPVNSNNCLTVVADFKSGHQDLGGM